MKAVCWCGKETMRVENVPDPKVINPRDAVVRIAPRGVPVVLKVGGCSTLAKCGRA